MRKKRFRLGYVCGDYGLIDNDEWIDLHSMSENSEKNVKLCINKMNELAEENEKLRTQVMENNCDNCKYSKAIYADVECRKKGLTEWKYNCDEFNGDVE